MKAPELPPTPDPSPPKRLGPLDWVRMIVLAVVFSIIGVIAWAVLLPQTELKAFFVLAVIPLGIATFVAGRIVGWHGEGKWITAFVLNIVICSVIAIAAAAAFIASTPPGAFY